jgi:hypothetical protein
MSKRRPTIRGRGAEILFGDPPPVEIEPRASELVPTETLSPEPKLEFDEAELERALFEEAQDGEAGVEGEEPPPPVPPPEPATPETELAVKEDVVPAEEPPQPVVEEPTPTMEETMDEQEVYDEAAYYEPPPPEDAVAPGSVVPPRPSGWYMDMEGVGALDIQEGEEGVEAFELPERALTEDQRLRLLARVGSGWIQALNDEIDETYDQVLSKVGENEDLVTECYNQLLKARDILLRRDAARFPQAEYYVQQARARLKRAAESESGAKKYAWWIAIWGLFWFVAYTAGLILLNYGWFQGAIAPASTANSPVDMAVFMPAMIWGGIGGVAAVFYSLFKHVGRRDFDTQYNLSYVGKPFLGVILGATVYMIIRLLIMTLGILPVGLAEGSAAFETPTVAPWIIYLLAWACGFKENRIFDLVDRVMKQIFSGKAATTPTEPAGPAG